MRGAGVDAAAAELRDGPCAVFRSLAYVQVTSEGHVNVTCQYLLVTLYMSPPAHLSPLVLLTCVPHCLLSPTHPHPSQPHPLTPPTLTHPHPHPPFIYRRS